MSKDFALTRNLEAEGRFGTEKYLKIRGKEHT